MAKDEIKPAPKSALTAEWELFVAYYKSKNPKKHAHKEAQGQFKEPTPEFIHSVENGDWAKAKAKLGIK